MRKFFRTLFSAIITLLILAAAAITINMNTTFFKNIGTYIPFLENKFPYLTQYISDLSDDVNSEIAALPSLSEALARLRNVELPIDPDDIAANVYYADDSMLTFNSIENVSVKPEGNSLAVYGKIINPNKQHLVYQFLDQDGNGLSQTPDACDADGEFMMRLDIPDNTYQFAIFTGSEAYGQFSSIVYNYVYLEQDESGVWKTTVPMVFDHNTSMFEKNKSIKNALKNSFDISPENEEIISLAQTLTNGCETDYDKAAALHDWVCANIYYDSDNVFTDNHIPYTSTDVLTQKRAVCLGYSNLYAALCRASGIPCNVVTGYAPEVGTENFSWHNAGIDFDTANHAWNEVHLDNRWVIVDTTWDSKNKIQNGEYKSDGEISHIFFDANLRFFSVNHKILDYK